MQAYILSIAGVVLIAAVVTMIAPSGKMGKFVKGTVRLFILVVMLSPLIGWLRGGEILLPSGNVITEDIAYLTHCAELLEQEDTEEITAYISENFVVSAKVDAKRSVSSYFPLEKITVIVTNSGINDEDERIHILTNIRDALAERYGCEVEVS